MGSFSVAAMNNESFHASLDQSANVLCYGVVIDTFVVVQEGNDRGIDSKGWSSCCRTHDDCTILDIMVFVRLRHGISVIFQFIEFYHQHIELRRLSAMFGIVAGSGS